MSIYRKFAVSSHSERSAMLATLACSWKRCPRMAAHEEQLRRLALHDEAFIESVLAMDLNTDVWDTACRLSPRTRALVRLAALLALGAAPISYQWNVALRETRASSSAWR
jgi:hypothetical protein